ARPHAAQNAFRRVSAVFRALPPFGLHTAESPQKIRRALQSHTKPPQKSVVGISP
ncbi:hypothetical protein NTO26_002152, partial [Neisseria gonorrhoeae]